MELQECTEINELIDYQYRSIYARIVIFAAEFIYGLLLKLVIKKCPWEYRSKWAIMGVVRIDYLPFWLVFGYILELIYRGFVAITIY